MNDLLKRAKAHFEKRKAIALGFLKGEIGRVGPARVRPANTLTLIWLQAVFGSVEEAFAPLLGDEPSVDRLIHILAILDVSTDRRSRDYQGAIRRIKKLRERLSWLPTSEIMRGFGLLVLAFEGMRGTERD